MAQNNLQVGMVEYSTITCPYCKARHKERMPEHACQISYRCPSCGKLLKSPDGRCCVFCAYGDYPCPPVQTKGDCCS